MTKKASVLGGTMIVASTTIGAGMLALPVASAGMWFSWSIIILLMSCFFMLISAVILLEVNLYFEPGASFNTLTQRLLGRNWSIITGLSVMFVLYILVYAYISGGGSVIIYAIQKTTGQIFNRTWISLLFTLPLIFIVWCSTWIVDRIAIVLMIIMVFSFIVISFGLVPAIDFGNYFSKVKEPTSVLTMFIWATLSTYLTSFCFHASVPSLVKYFGKDPVSILKCCVYGISISFGVYFIWIFVINGIVSRDAFREVIAQGGNVGILLQASGNKTGDLMFILLEVFSFSAITTSFLGAGLGLFDYLSDLLHFDNTVIGRTKTTCITFIPPLIGGIFFPEGFIQAIAWAGLFAAIWSVIVPALLLRALKKDTCIIKNPEYTFFKNNGVVYVLITYGLVVAICHVLVMYNILPQFS
ncbi:MAG: aromatic amino acid transporter [Brevinema sp.]